MEIPFLATLSPKLFQERTESHSQTSLKIRDARGFNSEVLVTHDTPGVIVAGIRYRSLSVEIGCGSGIRLIKDALEEPGTFYIGVDPTAKKWAAQVYEAIRNGMSHQIPQITSKVYRSNGIRRQLPELSEFYSDLHHIPKNITLVNCKFESFPLGLADTILVYLPYIHIRSMNPRVLFPRLLTMLRTYDSPELSYRETKIVYVTDDWGLHQIALEFCRNSPTISAFETEVSTELPTYTGYLLARISRLYDKDILFRTVTIFRIWENGVLQRQTCPALNYQ